MIFEAVLHEQTRDYIYPLERNKLAVRIRTKRGDAVSCKLIYWNRQKRKNLGIFQAEMLCYARDKLYDYYETVIDTKETSSYIQYYFEIFDGMNTLWLNYHGISSAAPENGFFEYLYTNENDIFTIPDWLGKAIFYQIFPERYYNADKANDPENTVKWGSKPTVDNFMGGDIKGISEKVGYLKKLGINAVYLTPVFEAPSNHKYDTVDYLKIDPHFGNLSDMKQLVQKLHENGIRVLLDGVFNHCGYFSKQFQDVLEKGENSIYKEWFYIDGFPVNTEEVNYECVGYYKWMPKLRIANPEVREYILKVASYWLKETDIDGWRLDVADEVDFTFWQEFRKLVKSIKPQSVILAETWRENREMLRGDQMDSVMNYLFRDAVVDFFAKGSIDSFEFDSRINKFLGVYPRQAHYALFNLLSSHDTARFLTVCGGDRKKFKLAVAFQMCFIGVPSVYYGDEIGLQGENDPDCRGAMEWDEARWDKELYEWYVNLIGIRKTKRALTSGVFRSVYCSPKDRVYAFLRATDDERIYIVLNNDGACAEVELPVLEKAEEDVFWEDLISGERFEVKELNRGFCYNGDINKYRGSIGICLKPYQVCIFCKKN